MVVAPALMTSPSILYRNSMSDLLASSGLNSMSVHPRERRCCTALTALSTTCSTWADAGTGSQGSCCSTHSTNLLPVVQQKTSIAAAWPRT